MIKWILGLFKREKKKYESVPMEPFFMTNPTDCVKKEDIPFGYKHIESHSVPKGLCVIHDMVHGDESQNVKTRWDELRSRHLENIGLTEVDGGELSGSWD